MKAAQINEYGGPEKIIVIDRAEKPAMKEGQVLIEIHAAGLNPIESAIRNGYMQGSLTLPITVGGDFSGIIAAVAEDVTDFQPGDEVYGIANHFKGRSGAAAEYAAANADSTALKPESVDFVHAAALPLVGASAYQAIKEHIQLQEDQKILIHGGGGGIGALAVQLAKDLGGYIIATAATDDVEYVKSLGADEVIDYKMQDFTKEVSDLDAVFDTTAGDSTNPSIPLLKKGGILVTMSGKPDEKLAAEQGITAITQMTKGDTEQLNEVAELVDTGVLKSRVDKIFPLDHTREAFEYFENAHPRGKVIIQVK